MIAYDFHDEKVLKMVQRLKHPLKFGLYTMSQLPIMWFAGARVLELTEKEVAVKLPFRWSTKNPFNSVYFAAQMGAAELSTGLAVLLPARYYGNISMLVTGAKSSFLKKASTDVRFVFSEAQFAAEEVYKAIKTGQSRSFDLKTIGYDTKGDIVMEAIFNWSVKQRSLK
jgi:acyl-coenzyme A thioesterase PaaI-like protein